MCVYTTHMCGHVWVNTFMPTYTHLFSYMYVKSSHIESIFDSLQIFSIAIYLYANEKFSLSCTLLYSRLMLYGLEIGSEHKEVDHH